MADAPTQSRDRALPEAWRVEIFRRAEYDDPAGTQALAAARELGLASITAVRMGRGYLFPPALGRERIEGIVRELLADPVVDEARVTEPGAEPRRASTVHRILVARKPGVMDPVALTIERSLRRDGLAGELAELFVTTFRAWEIAGDPRAPELSELARRTLANEVIEEIAIDAEALPYRKPLARPRHGRIVVPLTGADDAALSGLSRQGGLALSLEEMRVIQAHYRELSREPSACELETLAQTWSEHCQHKTFRGRIEMDGETIDNLLKTTIVAATQKLARPWCLSVFHDNAGVIELDEEYGLAFKVETHNHPSAIDPYGGAGTGVGGVIRDILGVGLGAKPIANTDAFFVGPPDLPEQRVPKGSLHPRRILRGVVAGVRDYGNCMGIPTVSGGVWFDEGFVANPLVFCGTLGLIRATASRSKCCRET
jgi:phosphoribosylformylglycinamidine synthase